MAFELHQNGYPNVAALQGGLNDWIKAGYPTE
ncbi:MAG: rhodanese-like domain-containing protein [Caldilineaceae bacterium]